MKPKIPFCICRVMYVVMAIYAQSMLCTCICTCQSVQPTTCATSFLLLLESLPDFCVPVLPSSCPSTSQKTIGHLAEDMKKVLLPFSITQASPWFRQENSITLHAHSIENVLCTILPFGQKVSRPGAVALATVS